MIKHDVNYVYIFFSFLDTDQKIKVAICQDKITKKWCIPGGNVYYLHSKGDNPILEAAKKHFVKKISILTGLNKQNKLAIRFPHFKITGMQDIIIDNEKIRTYWIISLERILMKTLIRHPEIIKVRFEPINTFIHGRYNSCLMSDKYRKLLNNFKFLNMIDCMEYDIYHKCSYLHKELFNTKKIQKHIEDQYNKIESDHMNFEAVIDIDGESYFVKGFALREKLLKLKMYFNIIKYTSN